MRLLPILLISLVALPVQAQDLTGPVEALDGDTLTVDGTAVRLAGIDAPDLADWCRRGGYDIPCGSISRSALLDLVVGATVECSLTGSELDGRPAALCHADGFEINSNMIYTGWALPLVDDGPYADLRDGAKTSRRGLWATDYVNR